MSGLIRADCQKDSVRPVVSRSIRGVGHENLNSWVGVAGLVEAHPKDRYGLLVYLLIFFFFLRGVE